MLRRRVHSFVIIFLFFSSLLVTIVGAVAESTSVTLQRNGAAYAQTSSEEAVAAGIQSAVLDNGLTVLMQSMHSTPLIGISVVYGAGSANDNKDEAGVAHLLEHMLFKGTEERPIRFGRLFHALGSSTNALTVEDRTVYHHLVAGRDKISAILMLEADRMLNTQILDEELATEKNVVAAERKKWENDSITLLNTVLFQAAYPNRAYGSPILGTETSIEGLTEAQVRAFYKKYYSPSNATLILIGDFDVDE
ncbi:MAG: pitrilysin family protein, partial [Cyanobacteria bacterium P01_A01_bin.17]